MRHGLIAGVNVDRLNIAAGLRELAACGYSEPFVAMVITHALMRWSRGEEAQAQRGAIDKTFHGVNLISWTRILASAMANAEAREQP